MKTPATDGRIGGRYVALRHFLILCGAQLRRTDRGSLIFVVLPLLIVGVLGTSLQGLVAPRFVPARPYAVVIAGAEDAALANVHRRLAAQTEMWNVETATDPEAAQQAVLQRRADAAVIVPGDPESGPLRIIAPPHGVVSRILFEMLRSAQLQALGAPGVDVTWTAVASDRPAQATGGNGPAWLPDNMYQYYAVALTAMFTMFVAHGILAATAQGRAGDLYGRLRTLGVRPVTYMAAGAATAWLIGILYIVVMTVCTALLFGVSWGGWGGWLILTALSTAALAGLSFAVTACVPSTEHVEEAGITFFMIFAFLGGSMSPLQVLPEWFVTAFAWLPNRAMLSAFLKLAGGAALRETAQELAVLGLGALATWLLGAIVWGIRTRRETA